LAPQDSPSAAESLPSPDRRPRHIAIIMDGNGRWAERQGRPRMDGHTRGADSVECIVEEAVRLGIEQLTLYCLSSENWKRPAHELDFLMQLLEQYLVEQRSQLIRQNIRFVTIGSRVGLPETALAEIDESMRLTASNTGLRLALAINYGGRQELVAATQRIAEKVARGELAPGDITEETISDHLDTAGHPDPDLLIRTAGEMRISNFLLWQISYAELWVTDRCWPEFRVPEFHEALREYARRVRRFGGLER
jgi:undecaprenyl diphosphate synthase